MAINPHGLAFGARLKAARLQRGFTQKQVVEAADIGESTYIRWENGDVRQPGREEIRRVCDVLNIPVPDALLLLGYLRPEEAAAGGIDQIPEREREVIETLRDPRVPREAVEHVIGYLRYLRERGVNGDKRAS